MDDLKAVVKEFISYLDRAETSEEGREVRLVTICCIRALMVQDVDNCLLKMKELTKDE